MKITAKILSIFALLLALSVSAEEAGQEIRIYPTGEIYLIGAELVRKHANNFYTIRSWNLKWALPVDATDTKIKIESAYGAPIGLAEILEGHLLEIRGKTKYQNFEHSIEPTLIKDLSVKTGESSFKNQPTPTQALTMTLKLNYRGGQVKILQDFLKKQGFLATSEKTTGVFGPLTQKALAEFQKANALEAIGTLGPKTRALINS